MKKFSELKVGDEFFSVGKISLEELESYLKFSGIKNVMYEKDTEPAKKMVSGRAILGRMEGEFTRLEEMYGNSMIFYGMDGDPTWKNRHTRFLKPLYTSENLKMKFTISEKIDLNENYGLLAIDFEGTKDNGDLVVVSKRNLYQIRKDSQTNQ